MSRPAALSHHSESGFTLTEMMIVVGVLVVLSGAIFMLFSQSQDVYVTQRDMVQVTQQARIAMDQITRYLRQAGNDPQDYMSGSSIPAVQILGAGHIRINSDLTGIVPAVSSDPLEATGDPDGSLDNLYEQVVFRYDSGSQELYVDIGYGEGVVAEGIASFTLTFFDRDGNTTAVEDDIVRVSVELVAKTEDPGRTTGKVQSITLQSDVMLRSKTIDIFS